MGSNDALTAGPVTEKEKEGASTPAATTTPHANIPEIMSSLPTAAGFPPFQLRRYGGLWLTDRYLEFIGAGAFHARFKPRPTDVLLASFPKSGTTWLKALGFCALNRVAHPPSAGSGHPLHCGSPHDLVRFVEGHDDLLYEELPHPRLLATHLPYSLLPDGVTGKEDGSGGRIVYVCRDPKDTLVSFWHFHQKTTSVLQQVPGMSASSPAMPTFEEAFELFCQGQTVTGCLKKMASFMGCPFSPEEEAAGVVREVVELCSLGKLKGLQVNKSGSTVLGIKNEAFFRSGTVGDWSSCMTPAMAAQLDGIVAEALRGSTLTFGPLAPPIICEPGFL
ncbi:cytosolic sulfotransferase 5 [Aegilops tauschii subsp. strangulata]|uniref:Sulfotransferase n=1 Tax=Aegilops tauschii subsp. strangulata TaxID=200361 RepID=A0A453A7M9_AEGTS|nr:cytosolic sulfotransferase 5 [Aegilops tauschii subsp. strangulata]